MNVPAPVDPMMLLAPASRGRADEATGPGEAFAAVFGRATAEDAGSALLASTVEEAVTATALPSVAGTAPGAPRQPDAEPVDAPPNAPVSRPPVGDAVPPATQPPAPPAPKFEVTIAPASAARAATPAAATATPAAAPATPATPAATPAGPATPVARTGSTAPAVPAVPATPAPPSASATPMVPATPAGPATSTAAPATSVQATPAAPVTPAPPAVAAAPATPVDRPTPTVPAVESDRPAPTDADAARQPHDTIAPPRVHRGTPVHVVPEQIAAVTPVASGAAPAALPTTASPVTAVAATQAATAVPAVPPVARGRATGSDVTAAPATVVDAPQGAAQQSSVAPVLTPEAPGSLAQSVAARVETAVEALRNAPPPREAVIDVDGLRVTVRLVGEQVQVAVDQPTAPRLARELSDALATRGLHLQGSGAEGRPGDGADGRPGTQTDPGDRRDAQDRDQRWHRPDGRASRPATPTPRPDDDAVLL